MEILAAKQLKKYYQMGDTVVKALDGIDLSIQKGEFAAVVGKSGSGKSTLLHMLGGLDYPTGGEVRVDGRDISRMGISHKGKDELTIFRRRKIGFVFQNYNLLPLMNVYENIVLPIKLDGIRPDEKFVGSILEMLGLKDKNMPCQTSCRAGSSSGWPWPGRWRQNQPLSWQTSLPETWTAVPARMYWG